MAWDPQWAGAALSLVGQGDQARVAVEEGVEESVGVGDLPRAVRQLAAPGLRELVHAAVGPAPDGRQAE